MVAHFDLGLQTEEHMLADYGHRLLPPCPSWRLRRPELFRHVMVSGLHAIPHPLAHHRLRDRHHAPVVSCSPARVPHSLSEAIVWVRLLLCWIQLHWFE